MTSPRPPLGKIQAFLGELKRRRVYRVTAIYVVLAVGALEILDLLVPSTSLPEWASPLLLAFAIVGLPVVLVLAWSFDVTPAGVVRTPDADATDGAMRTKTGSEAEEDAPDDSTTDQALDSLAVAVLPFDNLGAAPDAEPFAVGLHDDLLTELSRASALTVISRTSVRAYRGTGKSVPQIGRELGAGTIVEGGVQMVGNRVRLNIQLIDARTDVHLWAERYDRELTAETVFDLQTELAEHIMTALETRLTAAEQSRTPDRPTDDLEAYRLYHLGREAFVDRSLEGMKEAVDRFEAALERDPEYAHAWAGLGMACIALVDYGHLDEDGLAHRGREASLKAVELDPELAEAHAAVGNMYGYLHDGPAARDALARAMRLGPGLVLGYQWASWVDLCTGDPHSALAAARRATRLDPLEPEARGNFALAHLALGDAHTALAEARRIEETHPGFSYGLWVAGLAEHALGLHEEAVASMRAIREPQFRGWGPLAECLRDLDAGRIEAAAARLPTLRESGAFFQAGVLAGALGDVDDAFSLFASAEPLFWDEALALRYWDIEPVRRARVDERYTALLKSMDARWGVEGG